MRLSRVSAGHPRCAIAVGTGRRETLASIARSIFAARPTARPSGEPDPMTAANPQAPIAKPARLAMLDGDRYPLAAIVLHWTIAAAIVVQLCLGWYMNE